MPGRLRLLWVTPQLPRRGVTASRERWWQLLARAAGRHAVTLLAFVDPEDAGAAGELPAGLAAVHLVPRRPYRPVDPLALLPKAVAGALADPEFGAAVRARLAAEPYDVVQYEWIETAACIPPAPVRSLLCVHQVHFAQHAAAWRAEGGLRPGAVRLHRWLRELDFELGAVRCVDRVITMSAEDAARLTRFAPDLRVSVSPVGVDTTELRPRDGVAPACDLLFVGHFGHPPNTDAVRFLVRDVLPRLGRDARVRVIGRGGGPELAGLAAPGRVEILGAVDDLRPHLAAARAVVAPVRFGTGMRGKILEALAMARPVVTTTVGAEGLGATSGRHLLVADGAADFAAAVARVLDDPDFAAALGAAGRALVVERFDWDAIAAAHEEIWETVLREPPVARPVPLAHAGRLAGVAGRLGWAPGVALGTALLAARALKRHAARAAHGSAPAPARPAVLRGGTAA